jgi:hypothetical protein
MQVFIGFCLGLIVGFIVPRIRAVKTLVSRVTGGGGRDSGDAKSDQN